MSCNFWDDKPYVQHYDEVEQKWRKVNRQTGEIVAESYEHSPWCRCGLSHGHFPDMPIYHSPEPEMSAEDKRIRHESDTSAGWGGQDDDYVPVRMIRHEFPDGIVWGVTNAERILQGGADVRK